jgi:hypothetical protein
MSFFNVGKYATKRESKVAGTVSVDIEQITLLATAFDDAIDDLEPNLADDIFKTGQKVLQKAGQLSDWSAKIPPTLRLKMINKLTALITAGNEHVAIAYMFEIGRTPMDKTWFHPVFPGPNQPRAEWGWTRMNRPHRPYLTPALLDVGLAESETIIVTIADNILETIEATVT